MVVTLEKPLERMVLPNISWDTFERVLDEIGETHYRVTYKNGDLEFMTISFEHENFGEWIGRLIFFVALEFNIPLASGGSTTLKLELQKVGLEPDRCFWIANENAMRGKKKWNALNDPPPDLAIEIDITSSWLDRLEIYAALKVTEVWRFDGETLKVLLLGANGKYKARAKSTAFPMLPLKGFVGFIKELGSADEITLIQRFTDWLRSEVVVNSKNGNR